MDKVDQLEKGKRGLMTIMCISCRSFNKGKNLTSKVFLILRTGDGQKLTSVQGASDLALEPSPEIGHISLLM